MQRFVSSAALLLGCLGAQSLVKDIHTGPLPQPESSPGHLTTIGSTTYFAATTSAGRELWKTDGTATGTVLVRDIYPGYDAAGVPFSSNPRSLVPSGNQVFFLAHNVEVGDQLWKSDGTSEGTVPVRPDAPTFPDNLTAFGANQLLFTINGELWITDGSATATVRLAVFNFPFPSAFSAHGGEVLFAASGDATGIELWKTNGTSQGTLRIADLNVGPGNSSPRRFTGFQGWVYFDADGGSGVTQWRTDGTTTERLSVVAPAYEGAVVTTFHLVGGQVLYARNDGVHGVEIWKGDGSLAGSSLVKDLRPGPESCVFENMAVLGNELLFLGYTDQFGGGLYKSDGTASGTDLVSLRGPSSEMVPFAGGVIFSGDARTAPVETVIFTDGTTAGTVPLNLLVLTAPQEQSNGRYFAWSGNRLLLQATYTNQAIFKELFVTDGTAAGTTLLRDISGPGETLSSDPVLHGSYQGRHYFTASTATATTLWMTDGTNAGTLSVCECSAPRSVTQLGNDWIFGMKDTVNGSPWIYGDELFKLDAQGLPSLILDIYPGDDSRPGPFAPVGSRLVFPATDYPGGTELWSTDGTASGTQLVLDINPGLLGSSPASLMVVGNLVCFTANDGVTGVELWSTDGTTAGTTLVKDIRSGAVGSSPQQMAVVNGLLVFSADDGVVGRELWVSDGTTTGTMLLKDIRSGSATSNIARMTSRGDVAFFSAQDAPSGQGISGNELWRTDGTAAGTWMVKDIRPGNLSSIPIDLVLVGPKLFFRADDGVHGREPFVSDGTAAGTFLLADILPGSAASVVTSMVAAGSVLFFVANEGQFGAEPWISDGTSAGTRLVRDVYPDQRGSDPSDLFVVGDSRIMFAATEPVFGRELWLSDGTPVGTQRLTDIAPLTQSSVPKRMTRLGPAQVVFTANDSLTGVELWSMPFAFPMEASVKSYGLGCARPPLAVPALLARGAPRLGARDFQLVVSELSPGGRVALGFASSRGALSLGAGCTVLLGAPIEFLATQPASATSVTCALPIPWSETLVGTAVRFQACVVDPQGIALSGGLEVVVGY